LISLDTDAQLTYKFLLKSVSVSIDRHFRQITRYCPSSILDWRSRRTDDGVTTDNITLSVPPNDIEEAQNLIACMQWPDENKAPTFSFYCMKYW